MDYFFKTCPVKKNRYTIGFLDDNQDNEFHNQILAGIVEAANELDIDVIRFSYYSSHIAYKFSHQVDMVLDHIGQYHLDGLIFLGWTQAGAMYNYDDFMRRFRDIPLLSLGTSYDSIPSVVFEGNDFIREIVLHLIREHHFWKIAYIEHHRPDSRTDAYMRTMEEFGIYDPLLYVSDSQMQGLSVAERNRRAVEILLDERKIDIDAIVSLNVVETGFLLDELKRREIQVPSDIAVVSYEDDDTAKYASPGYTTVYFPWRELGYMGCVNILKLLREGSIPMVYSLKDKGRIIYRESCGCMPYYIKSAGTVQKKITDHGITDLTESELHKIVSFLDGLYKGSGICSERLIKSFISSCKSLDSVHFLKELDRQLRNINNQSRVGELISKVRACLFPWLIKDVEMLLWAGDLFLQSQVLVSERSAGIHGGKVLNARVDDQNMQLLSQTLLFNFNFQNVIDSLEKGMPLLNIKSCYIFISNSIFTDSDVEEDLFDNSVLLFRFTDGKKEKTSGVAGSLKEQLSEILSKDPERVFLAYLLHVTDEVMGFALFSYGPADENIYRTLSTNISTALRGVVLLNRLNTTYKKLVDHAQREGIADIATNILHNIGNILNSISVSVHLMEECAKSEVTEDIIKAGRLLQENMNHLEEFISEGGKGKKLMKFYLSLGRTADKMQKQILYNLDRLKKKTEAINEVVFAQQSYAGADEKLEELYVETILADALKLNQDDLDKFGIKVEKNILSNFKVVVNRAKLFFIIFNIISNAKDAMTAASVREKRLTVSMGEDDTGDYVKISDTGIGIPEDLLGRIFEYGFSTKSGKYGYGLYSCASYIAEIGGSISAHSDGEGKGAVFVLRFS